jgi:hypothetical protein
MIRLKLLVRVSISPASRHSVKSVGFLLARGRRPSE